ncbi:MAG: YdcF family protein [Pseudomonadota bacterium]
MIRRIASLFVLAWALGFGVFAVSLPGPAGGELTDAIVVLTGGKGRIERGLEVLGQHQAQRMLVSGVDPSVRAGELATLKGAPPALFRCCVDLGKEAVDTRTNADETARWLDKRGYKSVRLVTTDWHMPRARLELGRAVGKNIRVVGDSVESAPGLIVLVREYNKFWLRWLAIKVGL